MLPWLTFALGFFATTVIGALIIGYSEGERWGIDESRHINLQVNLWPISPALFAKDDYWWILKVSLAIPCLGAILAVLTMNRNNPVPAQPAAAKPPELLAARLIFAGGILWLLARVLVGVPNPVETIRSAWGGSFETHYRIRYLIMQMLTPQEFGMAYCGLLCLLTIPLHRALVTVRDRASWIELAVWYLAYATMAGFLIQKLLLSFAVFLAGLAIATAGHVMKYWRRLACVGIALFAIIHFAMSQFLPEWKLSSSIDHIIGRTADAYPYAVSMGVKHPFSPGQYLVGSVTGRPASMGEPAKYNLEIYDLMYPKNEGAMAVAAPVWSYMDVGRPGVWITMLLISGLCAVATWLSRDVDYSIWSWSVYLLIVMQLYHLTQMPIIGIIFWSYAAVYGLIALVAVAVAGRAIRKHLRKTQPALASPHG